MNRTISENFKLYVKGMVMGIADAFPGISGGTMAFILGIYEELISSISNINYTLFKTLKNEGLQVFWKKLNGNFLIILFSGLLPFGVIFVILAGRLMKDFPILIWSFFFGLVYASIYVILKSTNLFNFNKKYNYIAQNWILLLISIYVSYLLTSIPELNSLNENMIFIFFAGFIASCAMILPGISGSYILAVLGLYEIMSKALEGALKLETLGLTKILIFGFGIILGLLSFSKVVKWGIERFPNKILILMTGLIIGSIHELWPWKSDTKINISPFCLDENYLIESIVLFIIGFFLIFLLEKSNKNQNIEKNQSN